MINANLLLMFMLLNHETISKNINTDFSLQ